MNKKKNKIPEGFLKNYQNDKKNEIKYIRLETGFLKLEYGLYNNPGVLCLVSFVLDKNEDAIAIGSRLEIILNDGGENDEVTFISENGVSGLQWSNGEVIWGHTYDDDSAPGPGRKISLDDWIDECIDSMINPDDEEIEERIRLDKEDEEYLKE
jgi:hypothetical protein